MILNFEARCFFPTLTLYWCFAIDAISQAKTGFEKKNISDMSLTIYIVYVYMYKYLIILNSF